MALLNNGMTHLFLAVNYREDPNDSRMGCFKGFADPVDANKWLMWRTRKAATSPKGMAIYTSMDDLVKEKIQTRNKSLQLALDSYIRFCERCR